MFSSLSPAQRFDGEDRRGCQLPLAPFSLGYDGPGLAPLEAPAARKH